jgi:hypothetical protein
MKNDDSGGGPRKKKDNQGAKEWILRWKHSHAALDSKLNRALQKHPARTVYA